MSVQELKKPSLKDKHRALREEEKAVGAELSATAKAVKRVKRVFKIKN